MKVIDWKRLKEQYGIPYSRQHVLRLEKMNPPRFPKRARFGNNSHRVVWVEEEIEEWLQGFIDNR